MGNRNDEEKKMTIIISEKKLKRCPQCRLEIYFITNENTDKETIEHRAQECKQCGVFFRRHKDCSLCAIL